MLAAGRGARPERGRALRGIVRFRTRRFSMGMHGCDHKCGTCGKCTTKTCPNRVKCKCRVN